MAENKQPLDLLKIEKQSIKEKIFGILAILGIILFPLILIVCFRVVKQYKRAIILRFGKVRGDSPAGPGIIWVIPCTDDVQLVDLRTQSFNLPPQEIITKDSVTITVDAVVYFHVLQPLNCLLNVQSYRYATELLTIATLRNILGQHTLYKVLTSRESISFYSRTEADKTTAQWGVVVERVEIKDVFLPYELQKAMAAEAEGTRIAKAKVIEAEGEIKAAENLKEASKIMKENPHIMLLRYLQTLNFIAANQSTTVLFPFPIDLPGLNTPRVRSSRMNKLPIPPPEPDNASTRSQVNEMEKGFTDREDRTSMKQAFLGFNLNRIAAATTEQDKCIEKCLVALSFLLVVIAFPLSLFTVFVVVRQFERAIILRNGKLRRNKAYGPGLTYYLPCVDTIKFTDLRIVCYAVPPQEALTKDALTVSVDAVVYYKIFNPVWAVVNVADYKSATQYLAATILRNALGTRKLNEILVDRPAVSYQIFDSMKNLTRDWGVHIVRVEVKDISLPLQLQRAMATEAESSRLANAKIIVARAEIESTKNLQIATRMLMDNPYCMQLRYLQSLQMISGDKTHTIVIPFSAETLKKLFNS